GDPEKALALAERLFGLDQTEEATTLVDDAEKWVKPEQVALHHKLMVFRAKLALGGDEPQKAIELTDKVMEAAGDDAVAYADAALVKSRAQSELGRMDDAVATLDTLLARPEAESVTEQYTQATVVKAD